MNPLDHKFLGPNVKKLIAHKAALLAVPVGCENPLMSALGSLSRPGNIAKISREAIAWVNAALLTVRQAAEPNPWKNADDEAIAGEILKGIAERRSA